MKSWRLVSSNGEIRLGCESQVAKLKDEFKSSCLELTNSALMSQAPTSLFDGTTFG